MLSAWLRVLTNTKVVRCDLDERIKFGERITRRMAGPGQPLAGIEHGNVGRGARVRDNQIGERRRCFGVALRHHETAQVVRLGDGGGKADARKSRSQTKQPHQAERQQIAPFRGDERMQFIEDDAAQPAEQKWRIGGSQQKRELLRRRQQDIRRIAALALTFRSRRIAGARLDADRQPHFADRRFQIARDVDGKRLERRNVEGVQAPPAASRRE